MRRDGEQIVIESLMDGRVAADAGDIGGGDGLTSMYRDLSPSQLPLRLGGWASSDVVVGLQAIADYDMTVAGYLDRNVAMTYLGLLGVNSPGEM